MDTKGHLYSLEVETQDIDIDQVDFTDDFREGSEINVSVHTINAQCCGWMELLVFAVSL